MVVINLKADTGLVDRSENTMRFYKDVRKYPTLSKEEEYKYFQMYHNGTKDEREFARDYIIKCNQRLVVAAAKSFANTENLMDYTNEANIGLIEAVDRFDETRGIKFSSYAMWYIKRALNIFKYDTDVPIRQTNSSKTFSIISKASNEFIQDNERVPTSEELMELINEKYDKKLVDSKDLITMRYTRIDERSDDSSKDTYDGLITEYDMSSASFNGYNEIEDREENQMFINSMLDILDEREQKILRLKFGMCEDRGMQKEYTTKEISDILGITCERVGQIERGALAKLKKEYKKRVR